MCKKIVQSSEDNVSKWLNKLVHVSVLVKAELTYKRTEREHQLARRGHIRKSQHCEGKARVEQRNKDECAALFSADILSTVPQMILLLYARHVSIIKGHDPLQRLQWGEFGYADTGRSIPSYTPVHPRKCSPSSTPYLFFIFNTFEHLY